MRIQNLVAVVTLTVIVGVTHQGLSQEDSLSPDTRRVNFPEQDLPAPDLNVPSATPVSDLRSQYLELVKTQSELMDDTTLTSEIARAEKTITELKAQQKLDAAKELLTSLSKDLPDSEAAKKATRMLQAETNEHVREIENDRDRWTTPDSSNPGRNSTGSDFPSAFPRSSTAPRQ